MDPITAGMLMGAATGGMNYLGQQQTNQMNKDMVLQQESFQREMSNSAHQREVADLEAAGLNPILSAGGSGASTPVGATAQMNSPLSSLSGAVSSGASTAMALREQNQKMDIGESTMDNLDADSDNKRASEALIENQAAATAKDVEGKAMANSLMKSTLPAQIKKANAEGNYAEVNQLMGIIQGGASTANQLFNPLKLLKGK